MKVAGWNNGRPNNKTGAGYGIRITHKDRDKFFNKLWSSVMIELENGEELEIKISKSFWGKCAELRGAKIGKWMVAEGLAPWPDDKPPKLKLEAIKGSKFRLIK